MNSKLLNKAFATLGAREGQARMVARMYAAERLREMATVLQERGHTDAAILLIDESKDLTAAVGKAAAKGIAGILDR